MIRTTFYNYQLIKETAPYKINWRASCLTPLLQNFIRKKAV